MKTRPILFRHEMVPFIQSGNKVQTRRVIKRSLPYRAVRWVEMGDDTWYAETNSGKMFLNNEEWSKPLICPYGIMDDHLWVREKWGISYCDDHIDALYDIWYAADEMILSKSPATRKERIEWSGKLFADQICPDDDKMPGWRPSIHMPRWASRLTLQVLSVRVEPLQAISDRDAMAEGVYEWYKAEQHDRDSWSYWEPRHGSGAARKFSELWDEIHSKRFFPWESNPWVWVIEFEHIGD